MKNLYLTFGIVLSVFLAHGQDDCASALPVTAGIYTVSAINGTEVPSPVCAPNGPGATAGEWYIYTPTQDYTLTVSTDLAQNAGLDTRFHVYTGSCGSLVCHDGDDDSGSGLLSTSSFPVLLGNSYIIAFDDRWDASGFDFELTETPFVNPTSPISFTATNVPTINGTYNNCVVDMNGDYLDDVVSVNNASIIIHHQQSNGDLIPTTYGVATSTYSPSWSIAAGDIDKNGFNDLVYGDGNGVSFMYADGGGTGYTESSTPEYVFSQRSNFVDINNDGFLDAFVCHDVEPNVYYINDGFNVLNHIQGGLGDHPEGGNYGSIWTDYDNDGDMDLFIAKCRGGASTAKINELHRNDGGGVFTDVSIVSNMSDPVQTWSSAWNDYDNDGYMDALIGASSSSDGWHKLMHNNGDGTFSDVTAGSDWENNTNLNIEHISYDFDNDGFTDVLGGGGRIMFNDGDMTFTPHDFSINNGPIGDLNNDGFLDIQVGSTIYYNDGNSNNWVKFNLQGVASNGNGIGTRITIYGDWGMQIRDIRSGEGFRNMNTLNGHFGIGAATAIDSAYISWPSGQIDVLYNPDINTSHLIVEGSNTLGLLSMDNSLITVSPNPTADFINISNFESLAADELRLYTFDGRFVMNIADAKTDVSKLESGRYIIRAADANGKEYATTFVKH